MLDEFKGTQEDNRDVVDTLVDVAGVMNTFWLVLFGTMA